MNIITWNMQGSNASTESKWNSGVVPLLHTANPSPIVCLQECGRVPASAELIDTLSFPVGAGESDTVEVYRWGGTRTRLGYYIFFHNWDQGGSRVNTAIVTSTPPQDFAASVALVNPKGEATWRPALGVQFGDTWVFSFHATSPGGPDGAGLLSTVATYYPSWVVAGDWNRAPGDLTAPNGSVICPPNSNTYSIVNPSLHYDYSVCSGVTSVTGTVLSLMMSDHFPVGFSF